MTYIPPFRCIGILTALVSDARQGIMSMHCVPAYGTMRLNSKSRDRQLRQANS